MQCRASMSRCSRGISPVLSTWSFVTVRGASGCWTGKAMRLPTRSADRRTIRKR
ncbi:hypothetical protein EVA_06533 [gut metagenome]|uniref:Uncharacterized protein n=1 Tax=gut metagenome TaxID=749906 RepID=J9GRY7_9ZZZZ